MRVNRIALLALASALLSTSLFADSPGPCKGVKTPTVQGGKPGFLDCNKKFTPLAESADVKAQANAVAPEAQFPLDKDSIRLRSSDVEFHIWQNDFDRRTFENQLIQTRIIFVVVLLLVLAGLFFSWVQFQHSFHIRHKIRSGSKSDGSGTEAAEDTREELTLGKDGIVIRSAYLGVIILAISMAFFFLYLKYVYPITQ
jgi:hypothetical protein